MNRVVVSSVGRTGLSVRLWLCVLAGGTMPLSVRVKHWCKESITEMDLYLTYYNIYPCSNCLFWYKKINKLKSLLRFTEIPRLMSRDDYSFYFALWNVWVWYTWYNNCKYEYIFLYFHLYCGFLVVSIDVYCGSRAIQLLGWEGKASADSWNDLKEHHFKNKVKK